MRHANAGWTWDYVFDWTILKYQRSAASNPDRPVPPAEAPAARPSAQPEAAPDAARGRRYVSRTQGQGLRGVARRTISEPRPQHGCDWHVDVSCLPQRGGAGGWQGGNPARDIPSERHRGDAENASEWPRVTVPAPCLCPPLQSNDGSCCTHILTHARLALAGFLSLSQTHPHAALWPAARSKRCFQGRQAPGAVTLGDLQSSMLTIFT
jgi:hypothetical protein